jgi:hypothetical protein
MIDPVLALLPAIGAGCLFLSAGVHKMRDLARFVPTLGAYRLLPAGWESVAAPAVIAAEITAGAAALASPCGLLWAGPACSVARCYWGLCGRYRHQSPAREHADRLRLPRLRRARARTALGPRRPQRAPACGGFDRFAAGFPARWYGSTPSPCSAASR